MQKLYNLAKVSALLLLLLIQNSLQAQNCCLDCPADVKVVTDKQVLLDKIEIKEGTTTKLNTNLYVSYRSGNAQKFWANLAIATAGLAVSTQLRSNPSVEGNNVNGISPLIPLGVSVATLPSIWKNRPRGIPQAGLWLQHRDTRGKLTDTWEQPISSEAKNSGELLSVNIDKPLSAGTVEVYLQNGSKNPVYYWGYEAVKSIIEKKALPPQTPLVPNSVGCPDGYLPNGQGMCCNPFNGECVNENQTNSTNSTCYLDIYQKSDAPVSSTSMVTGASDERQEMENRGYTLVQSIGFDCNTGRVLSNQASLSEGINVFDAANEAMNYYIAQHQNNNGGGGTGGTGGPAGCPSGFLPNGQGICCNPFTGQCLNGGGGPSSDSNCIDGVDPQGNPCYDSGGGGGGTENQILPENFIVSPPPPNRIITDVNKELKCFDLSKPAKITIYADQPQNNTRKPYTGNPITGVDVGHSYISIEQNGITRVIGFYPQGTVNPLLPSSSSYLVEDSTHPYSVKVSTTVNASTLSVIITQIKGYNGTYDLNNYNCTDFALSIAQSAGIQLPSTSGSWPGGSGRNPGDFGQDMRSINNPNVQKSTQSGIGPSNSGTCN